jgi:hypothetical protein
VGAAVTASSGACAGTETERAPPSGDATSVASPTLEVTIAAAASGLRRRDGGQRSDRRSGALAGAAPGPRVGKQTAAIRRVRV